MPPDSPVALSDDEFDRLAEFLDCYAAFDTDGLLGLLHAVVVAPGLVPPSAWFPVLVPEGLGECDAANARDFVGLVMRQYNDVADALGQGMAIMPEPEDEEGCEAFAAGFIAGAEIDPEWIEDADRWTFAAPFAYLAGRLDLVSKRAVADIESNLAPDPYADTSSGNGRHSRRGERDVQGTSPIVAPDAPHQEGRTRRSNEPCPCGSARSTSAAVLTVARLVHRADFP